MDFVLFILVNAALFLRPAELVEDWRTVQVYEPLILACLAFASFGLIKLFMGAQLRQQPLTLLVFALLAVITISGVTNLEVDSAFDGVFQFAKVLIYYLLLITVVNTPQRLKQFLFWITIFAGAISLLAVLQYHGVIALNLRPMEDRRGHGQVHEQVLVRLTATGIFADPNDFSALLVLAVPLCLYWIVEKQNLPLVRLAWLPVLFLFVYALILTQSRGGLIAFMLSVLVLLHARFGTKAAAGFVLVLLPLALFVFAARQTSLSTEDTTLSRFQQWQEGLSLLKDQPLFGVGMNQFEKHRYLVAHNSFMHCYGELGFIGGTLFFGAFFFALWALARLQSRTVVILDPVSRQLNPYLLAMVAGYCAVMMSLSISYLVPTYMVLGLTTVHVQRSVAFAYPPLPLGRIDTRLAQRLALASIAFLAVIYVTCRLLVRYS